MDHIGIHANSCKKNARAIKYRHDRVVAVLASILRQEAGRPALVEPCGLFVDDNRRPDIRTKIAGRVCLIDVPFTDPASASYVVNASKGIGSAAVARESVKCKKVRRFDRHWSDRSCSGSPS